MLHNAMLSVDRNGYFFLESSSRRSDYLNLRKQGYSPAAAVVSLAHQATTFALAIELAKEITTWI
jgi:hypothetical protein